MREPLHLVAALLACIPLPGCLTRALWHEEPVSPAIVTVATRCVVHEVTTPDQPAPATVGVLFSAPRDAKVPAHLRRHDADTPAFVELPWPVDDLPSAPSAWDLRVTAAPWLRPTGLKARVVLYGEALPRQIARPVVAEDVPADVRDRAALRAEEAESSLEQRCLLALRRHDWGSLLALDAATGPEALAWVDGDGRTVERLPVLVRERAAAGPALLVRLGEGLWTIPIAVLAAGDELTLVRRDGAIEWELARILDARLTAPPDPWARRPLALPLRARTFVWRSLVEVAPGTWLADLGRVLLTPVTVALDVAFAGDVRQLLDPARPRQPFPAYASPRARSDR